MSKRPQDRSPGKPIVASKALLLCQHAEELSAQCAAALSTGSAEDLLDWQRRKLTMIEALTKFSEADVRSPELPHAVDRLRALLQTETRALADAAGAVQNELLAIGGALRRCTHARRYNSASGSPLPAGGGQLSVCG